MTTGREILPSHELNKSPIGPIWLGRTMDAGAEVGACDEADLRLVRRLVPGEQPDDEAMLSPIVAAAEALEHPHILPLQALQSSSGELWLASGYVPGASLRSLMRLSGIGRKPAPAPVALKIVSDVLQAVVYLHEQRPAGQEGYAALGPDQIWIGTDGCARLMEPGVGAFLARREPWRNIAKRACYDAPESFDEPAVRDGRSDVFVAGVLLWELLRNRQLFSGSSYAAVCQRVTSGAVRRVDSLKPAGGEAISKDIADVVAKAVSRDPDARFATPKELLDALQAQAVGDASSVVAYANELLADGLKKQARRVEQALSGAPASSRRGHLMARSSQPKASVASKAAPEDVQAEQSTLLEKPESTQSEGERKPPSSAPADAPKAEESAPEKAPESAGAEAAAGAGEQAHEAEEFSADDAPASEPIGGETEEAAPASKPERSDSAAKAAAAAALMSPAAIGADNYDMLSIADDPSIEEELPEVARKALAAVAEEAKEVEQSRGWLLPVVLLALIGVAVMYFGGGDSDSQAPPPGDHAAEKGSQAPKPAGDGAEKAATTSAKPAASASPAEAADTAATASAAPEPSSSAAPVGSSDSGEASEGKAKADDKDGLAAKPVPKAPTKVRSSKRYRPRVRKRKKTQPKFVPSGI